MMHGTYIEQWIRKFVKCMTLSMKQKGIFHYPCSMFILRGIVSAMIILKTKTIGVIDKNMSIVDTKRANRY